MQKPGKEKIYTALIFLLVFCMFQLSVVRIYGFSLYPDEFGYWASAAPHAGYDWSKLASLGSYYSFGYSLLLTPILFFFKGVTAYRIAIALNYCMVFGVYLTTRGLFALRASGEDAKTAMLCACAAFYPPFVMFSQMTMVESLLTFLFSLLCFFLARYVKKPKAVTLAGVAAIAGYMYFVHMRSIGIVLALLLTFLIYEARETENRRHLLYLGLFIIIALLLFVFFKRNAISRVFSLAQKSELDINSYGSQGWKIKDIFSKRGFKDFLTEVAGKVYYLTAATFGTYIFTMCAGVRSLLGTLRTIIKRNPGAFDDEHNHKHITKISPYLYIFVMLCSIAQIMISAIYMHGSDRADSLLYGRYEELIAPVVIVLGLGEMTELYSQGARRKYFLTMLFTIAGIVASAPIFTAYFKAKQYVRLRGFFVSGIGYFNKYDQFDPTTFMLNAVIFGVVGIGITGIVIALFNAGGRTRIVMVLLIVLPIVLSMRLSEQWTYRLNGYVYTNLKIADALTADQDRTLYYLDVDDNYYVDFLQFMMPEQDFVILSPQEAGKADTSTGYLIVNRIYEGIEELTDQYEKYIESDMLRVFYD